MAVVIVHWIILDNHMNADKYIHNDKVLTAIFKGNTRRFIETLLN